MPGLRYRWRVQPFRLPASKSPLEKRAVGAGRARDWGAKGAGPEPCWHAARAAVAIAALIPPTRIVPSSGEPPDAVPLIYYRIDSSLSRGLSKILQQEMWVNLDS